MGTADGIRQVLGSSASDYRPVLRRSIHKDFVYIAGYVILFLFLGIWLRRPAPLLQDGLGYSQGSRYPAAVFDLIENFGMLRTISLNPMDITDAMAVGTRRASLFKWGFFFLTMLLLGLSLLPRLGLFL